MKIQSMSSQFTTDHLGAEQQVALFKHAGIDDMQLFYAKKLDASDLKLSLKQQMKDRMIQQMLISGGIDISSPIWRKYLVGDDYEGKIITESFSQFHEEPIKTIILMMKSSNSKLVTKGKELLKTYQYKRMNRPGDIISENMDHILKATDKSAYIKKLLKQDFFNRQINDPLDRAMFYYMDQKKQTGADVAKLDENIKDLQKIKIFQGSVPHGSPVTQDNLYAFYRMVKGKVQPADILNIALGQDLGPISELEFERYFGSPAQQFSCRAHDKTLRVPCGIDLEADECFNAGCCYDPNGGTNVPTCYHNLYGKIGSALLRKEYINSKDSTGTAPKSNFINTLFVNGAIPHLSDILRDQRPMLAKLSDNSVPNPYGTNKGFTKNWWESVLVQGKNPGQFGIQGGQAGVPGTTNDKYAIGTDQVRDYNNQNLPYGNPNAPKWEPYNGARGTASPYLVDMPGVNPTAGPNGDGTMDQYYKMWLAYAAEQDEAQCALIPKDSRVRCMKNIDAWTDFVDTTNKCKNAGCCFSEEAFLKDGTACYRAVDYGTCDVAKDFERRECGLAGITQDECISDVRCCYKPISKPGEPWCFYKQSATLSEKEWCTAFTWEENSQKVRKPCFTFTKSNLFKSHNDNGFTNVNNLVTQDVCERAECCYDDSLTKDKTEWLVEGLGLAANTKYRCFKKENPVTASFYGKYVKVNQNEKLKADGTKDKDLPDYDAKKHVKTCDPTHWDPAFASPLGKRSCGSNTSYYQCVYVNRCCYKPTVTNEPACYHPEKKK